jgi:hypothetical protein
MELETEDESDPSVHVYSAYTSRAELVFARPLLVPSVLPSTAPAPAFNNADEDVDGNANVGVGIMVQVSLDSRHAASASGRVGTEKEDERLESWNEARPGTGTGTGAGAATSIKQVHFVAPPMIPKVKEYDDINPAGANANIKSQQQRPRPALPLRLPSTAAMRRAIPASRVFPTLLPPRHIPNPTQLHPNPHPPAQPLKRALSHDSQVQPHRNLDPETDQGQDQDHRTSNVYINGLPPHYPESGLYTLTCMFGEVRSVRTFTRHVYGRAS